MGICSQKHEQKKKIQTNPLLCTSLQRGPETHLKKEFCSHEDPGMASVRWKTYQGRSQAKVSRKSLLCLAQIPSALANCQRAEHKNSQSQAQHVKSATGELINPIIMDKLATTLSNYDITGENQVASEDNAITHGYNNIIGSRVIIGRKGCLG